MKKGITCRFDFPRLSSNEITDSIIVDKDTGQGKIDLRESKQTKDRMKSYLQNEEFDEMKDLSGILRDLDISPEEYKKVL